MEGLLLSILLIVLAVGAVLAFRRIWVFRIRPESIQGSDLHMLKHCIKERTRAWGGVHFTFDAEADFDAIAAAIQSNIEKHFDLPGNSYRMGVDLEQRRYVTREQLRPHDVIDIVHSDQDFFATKDDERFRELVFRIYPEKRLVGVMFDHTVWDGLRLVNEIIVPMIESRPFASRWLLVDRYYPVLAELMQIYTILVMGTRWLTHRPIPNYPDESRQKVITHRFPADVVKSSKNRNEVKFTSALLGVWMFRLFESLDPERAMVRVGVIIATQSDRFRNNYTIVTVDVRRCDSEDTLVRSIERQFDTRKFEVLPLYHMISSIEAQTLFKKRAIDYLFSPGFFHSHSGVSKQITDMRFITIPIGMPFYSFACSIDDVITVSTTLNTPEVDVARFTADASASFSLCDHHTPNAQPWLFRER